MKKKISIIFGLVCLMALAVGAANPSFQSFNTTQFDVTGNQVSLTNGVTVTNINSPGTNGAGGTLLNSAQFGTGPASASAGAKSINTTATGVSALATNSGATSYGNNATANGNNASAYGPSSSATGSSTSSYGVNSTTSATQASAFGSGSTSAFTRSTAVGSGATTTSNDQVMIGTGGQTVGTPGTWFGNGASLTNVPGAWIDPTRTPYNAVGDGVTDDTAAITNALWAAAQLHLPVFLPMKTYKVSPFTLYTNQYFQGVGGRPKLLFASGSAGVGVTMDSTSTNIQIRNIEIDGGKALSIPGSDDGRTGLLYFNAAQPNWVGNDIYVHGFGTGIEVFTVGANNDPLGELKDCQIEWCWTGLKVDANAEYMSFTGIQSTENHFGCLELAGNNTFSSCNFSRNNGIDLCLDGTAGGNPGHCSFSSCAFNHSGSFAVTSTNNSFGSVFTSCSFLPPNIYVTNSQGLSWANCMMGWNVASFATMTFTNSSNCAVLFPQNPYGITNSYSLLTNSTTNIIYQLAVGTTNGFSIVDAQLTTNIPKINANNAFTGQNSFVTGSGNLLTLGAVGGPSIFINGSAAFTESGTAQGYQWNNLANSLGLMTLDNTGNLVVQAKITSPQYTTSNTNQFAIASTGWTNTNAFNCIMYITGATAATFTYSDGTNTIFTDTGLTFTTAETLIMHPSYKVVVASGTITGIAIVK